MTIRPFFKWFDLWVGIYIDTERRTVYVCPLPMVGVRISFGRDLRQVSPEQRDWEAELERIRLKIVDFDTERRVQQENG